MSPVHASAVPGSTRSPASRAQCGGGPSPRCGAVTHRSLRLPNGREADDEPARSCVPVRRKQAREGRHKVHAAAVRHRRRLPPVSHGASCTARRTSDSTSADDAIMLRLSRSQRTAAPPTATEPCNIASSNADPQRGTPPGHSVRVRPGRTGMPPSSAARAWTGRAACLDTSR